MANVLFKGNVVYNYAFSHNPDLEDINELSYDDICKFCKIIEKNIDPHKYVLFDLSDLYENADYSYASMKPNEHFFQCSNHVCLVKPLDENIAEQIENKYNDKLVTHALRTARDTIRQKLDYESKKEYPKLLKIK